MSTLTKQAIYASFLKALDEKPLDKITVKDIVDDCGINRKTFYYYFHDIYALTYELFQSAVDRLRADYPPETHSWQEAVGALADYMYQNRKITLHICRTVGYEKLESVFFDTCMAHIPRFLAEESAGLTVAPEDRTLITTALAATLAGVLARWITGGMRTLPGETVDRLALLLRGTTRLALENADRLGREPR